MKVVDVALMAFAAFAAFVLGSIFSFYMLAPRDVVVNRLEQEAKDYHAIALRAIEQGNENLRTANRAIEALRALRQPSEPKIQEPIGISCDLVLTPGCNVTPQAMTLENRYIDDICLAVVDIGHKDANGDGCLTERELYAP